MCTGSKRLTKDHKDRASSRQLQGDTCTPLQTFKLTHLDLSAGGGIPEFGLTSGHPKFRREGDRLFLLVAHKINIKVLSGTMRVKDLFLGRQEVRDLIQLRKDLFQGVAAEDAAFTNCAILNLHSQIIAPDFFRSFEHLSIAVRVVLQTGRTQEGIAHQHHALLHKPRQLLSQVRCHCLARGQHQHAVTCAMRQRKIPVFARRTH